MPAIAPVLSNLIKTKVNDYMKTAYPYGGPLSGQIITYYIEFCTAIGSGIASKSLGKIKWISKDKGLMGAPPISSINSIGKGIFIDKDKFSEMIYTNIQSSNPHTPPFPPGKKTTKWTDEYGVEYTQTDICHPPYPKGIDANNGVFLECITQGIADSIEEHYKNAWILQGKHPMIYMGTGKIEKFFGLVSTEISTEIQGLAPSLSGPHWVQMTEAIANAYVDIIHKHSFGGTLAITGICVPSPSQVCGLPGMGVGNGDCL